MSPLKQFAGLIAWLVFVFAFAAVGGFASVAAPSFYNELTQPAWAPPAWLFGPAWSVLYTLMGIAAWLVWRAKGLSGAKPAFTLFVMQLAFNALWTWLFFVWRMGAVASFEILILWVLILMTMGRFYQHSRLAAVLIVPYLAWVSFAAALSFAMWRLNPAMLG